MIAIQPQDVGQGDDVRQGEGVQVEIGHSPADDIPRLIQKPEGAAKCFDVFGKLRALIQGFGDPVGIFVRQVFQVGSVFPEFDVPFNRRFSNRRRPRRWPPG